MNHPVYEGMNGKGKGGGFITDFYAAFIFCSTRNSFLDRSLIMIVSFGEDWFQSVGWKTSFFSPSPFFSPKVKMR